MFQNELGFASDFCALFCKFELRILEIVHEIVPNFIKQQTLSNKFANFHSKFTELFPTSIHSKFAQLSHNFRFKLLSHSNPQRVLDIQDGRRRKTQPKQQ
jgi:hypothetical protein